MSKQIEQFEWPLLCLTWNTTTNQWYATLYVKHPHFTNAHRYRLRYYYGFTDRAQATIYLLSEFYANVDRNTQYKIVVREDVVFEWDGDGEPDPGAWVFAERKDTHASAEQTQSDGTDVRGGVDSFQSGDESRLKSLDEPARILPARGHAGG